MDRVRSIRVRTLVVPQFDRGEDETYHLREITHTLRVLGQNGGSPGHGAVKDRHFRP